MKANVEDHLSGCLEASFVADALGLGLHWVYDAEQLASLSPVAGFQDPAPDSYHPDKRAGDLSHVGDQALVLWQSVVACKGFDADDWARRWTAMWEGYGDYFDKATKHRLAEGEALASDELAGAARIAPLVAWYGPERREALFDAISAQTALTHAGASVRSAAWCLAELALSAMETGSVGTALTRIRRIDFPELDVVGILDQARGLPADDPVGAVGTCGRACSLVQAMPAVFYFLVHHGEDVESALVGNVMAGGDNCTRGLALGLVLGAAHGAGAIPDRWRAALSCRALLQR